MWEKKDTCNLLTNDVKSIINFFFSRLPFSGESSPNHLHVSIFCPGLKRQTTKEAPYPRIVIFSIPLIETMFHFCLFSLEEGWLVAILFYFKNGKNKKYDHLKKKKKWKILVLRYTLISWSTQNNTLVLPSLRSLELFSSLSSSAALSVSVSERGEHPPHRSSVTSPWVAQCAEQPCGVLLYYSSCW